MSVVNFSVHVMFEMLWLPSLFMSCWLKSVNTFSVHVMLVEVCGYLPVHVMLVVVAVTFSVHVMWGEVCG